MPPALRKLFLACLSSLLAAAATGGLAGRLRAVRNGDSFTVQSSVWGHEAIIEVVEIFVEFPDRGSRNRLFHFKLLSVALQATC